MDSKINVFEYLVKKLVDWYKEQQGIPENEFPTGNDLSKLKLFKLHFFVSAVNASRKDAGLLSVFDNFYALPYGPVESNVYNQQASLRFFLTGSSSLVLNDETINQHNWGDELSTATIEQIDSAIKELRDINPELITYSPFELVEISHKWKSWKIIFKLAQDNNKNSLKIPTKLIQGEQKFFFKYTPYQMG